MIIMQLLMTLRISPLSGGGANSNPVRHPCPAVCAFLSKGART
jgi:hypothetical protein